MPKSRRKISAVYRDFHDEIRRLERFNTENQTKFIASVGTHNPIVLSKKQLFLLTEAIFFNGFRAYENYIRDVFLLYCLEKRPRSNELVVSYLKPKNFHHAEELINSSMDYIDWSSPAKIIKRAELFLQDGFPIKNPITAYSKLLSEYKIIRNQIAHNSSSSFEKYKKVLCKHYRTIPLEIPYPGEFLLQPVNRHSNKYILLEFFKLMNQIAWALS